MLLLLILSLSLILIFFVVKSFRKEKFDMLENC